MKSFLSPLAFTIAFLLCVRGVLAQPDISARIDEFVGQEMARQKIPGVAVAMIHRGDVIHAKGYGLANIEHQVPVSPQTIFQSGSVGKQFTAAAVLALVEEGKLELDESITKYLSGAPASWAPITVRHLLTHTSGIPEYTTESFNWRRDYSEDELLRFAYELKPGSRPRREDLSVRYRVGVSLSEKARVDNIRIH